MNEELLNQLLKELKQEKIRFGTCEIRLTFHDGKVMYYEVCSNRRINVVESQTNQRGAK